MLMKNRWLATLNTLGLILALTLNGMAVYLPLNGISTAAVSDKFNNLFVPANFTFAIWGLIYLLLILFAAYQLKLAFGKKSRDAEVIDKIGPWFIISSICNAVWIVAWHNLRPGLALVLMAGLLISLIAMYVNLRVGKPNYSKATNWLVLLPISVYLGWISVATIANVAAWLTEIHWTALNLSPQFWAIAVIVVGLILAVSMVMRNADYAYSLVIAWAYVGIIAKRIGDSSTPDAGIITTATLSIAVILIVIGLKIRER